MLFALVLPAASLATTIKMTETYATVVSQIDSGQVIRAVVNRYRDDIKVTMHDGTEQESLYPAAQESALVRKLHAHHIRVRFARRPVHKKPAAVHHRLRYIAAGVLAALIVVGGGAYVVSRRSSPGAGADAPQPQDPGTT